MANKRIKGLTVEIGGDTTKLGKALETVESKANDLTSELGEINRQLKFDPKNTELLAQKQKVLAGIIEQTGQKLDKLKEAEKQVQQQFERGEVSEEQVRALQREIIATESKMESYKKAVKETADEVANLGKKSEDTSGKMAGALGTGLKAAGAGLAAAAAGATAAAESTREYRTDMGKLETAFTSAGHSTEAATNTYKALQGVLGDSAQAVEAASHLAQLATNEEDLAKWTEIATGVYATFGASLPVENITEAANETAKTGVVVGGLADAINWSKASADQWKTALGGNTEALTAFETATAEGMSAEDAFNEALAACSTEQERQALITSTLNGLYGEASTKYKETNADVIAANEANEKMTASLAAVGEKVEPLLTKVKELGAELLSKLVPVIDAITNNLPAIGVGLAGVTAAMVAFKIAAIASTAATKGMTLAQYAAAAAQGVLNAVMNANPIGLIILAITALVTAFMLLWKNCEGFRNFWIDLWDGIKNVFNSVVEWFKKTFDNFGQTMSNLFAKIGHTVMGFAETLKALPGKIWSAIVGAVSRVTQWGRDMVSKAKTAASNMLSSVASTLKALPGRVWSAIVGAVSRVGQWGRDMVNKAKTSITTFVNNVVTKLKELPGKVVSIGKDLVTGLWNGVKDKFNWLKNKLSGFATSVLDGIKSFFGVHSPSTETAWIGEMLDEGMAKGVEDNADTPLKAMDRLSSAMLDEASGDDLNIERRVSHTFAGGAPSVIDSGLLSKLDKILAAVESGKSIYLDGNTLVGATANQYDTTLGRRRVLAERGAI